MVAYGHCPCNSSPSACRARRSSGVARCRCARLCPGAPTEPLGLCRSPSGPRDPGSRLRVCYRQEPRLCRWQQASLLCCLQNVSADQRSRFQRFRGGAVPGVEQSSGWQAIGGGTRRLAETANDGPRCGTLVADPGPEEAVSCCLSGSRSSFIRTPETAHFPKPASPVTYF